MFTKPFNATIEVIDGLVKLEANENGDAVKVIVLAMIEGSSEWAGYEGVHTTECVQAFLWLMNSPYEMTPEPSDALQSFTDYAYTAAKPLNDALEKCGVQIIP